MNFKEYEIVKAAEVEGHKVEIQKFDDGSYEVVMMMKNGGAMDFPFEKYLQALAKFRFIENTLKSGL